MAVNKPIQDFLDIGIAGWISGWLNSGESQSTPYFYAFLLFASSLVMSAKLLAADVVCKMPNAITLWKWNGWYSQKWDFRLNGVILWTTYHDNDHSIWTSCASWNPQPILTVWIDKTYATLISGIWPSLNNGEINEIIESTNITV